MYKLTLPSCTFMYSLLILFNSNYVLLIHIDPETSVRFGIDFTTLEKTKAVWSK